MPPSHYTTTLWYWIMRKLHIPYRIEVGGYRIMPVAAYGLGYGWMRPGIIVLNRRRLPIWFRFLGKRRTLVIPTGRRYWDQSTADHWGKCGCCGEVKPCSERA